MIHAMIELGHGVFHPREVLLPTALAVLLLLPAAWSMARRLGGSVPSALLAAGSLIGVADVTVFRPGFLGAAHWSLAACVTTDPAHLDPESLLNVALLVPFAFFAVLTFDRVVPPAICAVGAVLVGGLVSCAIEVTQAAYAIGACDSGDVVHNVEGALVGAAVGLLVSQGVRVGGRALHPGA